MFNKSADARLAEIKATIAATSNNYKDQLVSRIDVLLLAMTATQRTSLSNSLGMNKQATKVVRNYIRAIGLIEALFTPATTRRTFTAIIAANVGDLPYLVLSTLNMAVKAQDPASGHPPDKGRHRPLLMGVSISGGKHDGPGSIGCFVLCNVTNKPMILGNEHVMRAEFGSANSDKPAIYQPSRGNGGGDRDQIATYDRGILDIRIDAAVAYLADGVEFANRTPEGVSLRRAATVFDAGDRVWKRGAASRRTDGRIQTASASASVPHARFGGSILFARQIEIVAVGPRPDFQIPGDSGSALFNIDNDIIGLMHGGGTDKDGRGGGLATPIAVVLDLLNVRLP